MNTAESISKAAASAPPPANIPLIAFAAATGAAQLATIKGQFHDGIDNVPKTGTYLLEGGERVVDKRLNNDLKNYLVNANNKTFNQNANINMNFGNDPDPDAVKSNRGQMLHLLRGIYAEEALPLPV